MKKNNVILLAGLLLLSACSTNRTIAEPNFHFPVAPASINHPPQHIEPIKTSNL